MEKNFYSFLYKKNKFSIVYFGKKETAKIDELEKNETGKIYEIFLIRKRSKCLKIINLNSASLLNQRYLHF